MQEIQPDKAPRKVPWRRWSRRRGAEAIEFTLVLFPLLGFTAVLTDTAWAIFAEGTLQRAVRVGVRVGVTLTSAQMAQGACLTDTVKGIVQQNAANMLSGSSGLALIKVNYFLPPSANSTAALTDVSTLANGDNPGNIMQVSVQGFSLAPLVARIFMGQTPDKNPLLISVNSADIIEPSNQPPCIGTAP